MSARSDATKRKLFTATLRLAGSKGLVGLTVDEIAAEAGVAKGTVYYNFESKDGLIDGLLRYGIGMLARRLRSAGDDPDPSRALESIVDAMLEFIAEYPGFSQIVVSELWRTPGQWHETLTLLRDDVVGILKERLEVLEAAGRMPRGVQVATAAAGLFGTLLVVALDWLVFQPQRTRAEVRDSVLLLVRGVTGGPAAGAP
ncbi:TetR family transcriptional regulator [Amycolatopsis antarctica]|uniref:TetR family transcriptional regulator n=1 Tax=Amycolatopsis antarctica TaxID=1854586 RepID=A0A263D155_9PSEU|nr:TetR/AcrR family transcriptional regulator [Amycolatopsis antarctica]OZM72162.1 TetR family transcriptional regulator [Amycolatopsis antarctica]